MIIIIQSSYCYEDASLILWTMFYLSVAERGHFDFVHLMALLMKTLAEPKDAHDNARRHRNDEHNAQTNSVR